MSIIQKFIAMALLVLVITATAGTTVTNRIPYFANNQVKVWKSIIYPSEKQILKPHRHDNNRVVVAFNDGVLKVTNNKGQVHYLKLAKEQAYYLPKDIPGETHTDENVCHHPIRLVVIEVN
jgi:hypothetical protein